MLLALTKQRTISSFLSFSIAANDIMVEDCTAEDSASFSNSPRMSKLGRRLGCCDAVLSGRKVELFFISFIPFPMDSFFSMVFSIAFIFANSLNVCLFIYVVSSLPSTSTSPLTTRPTYCRLSFEPENEYLSFFFCPASKINTSS